MKKNKILFLLFFLASCIYPYEFEQESFERLLVVEGYIADRPGDAEIRLEYSDAFDAISFEKVRAAKVMVIEDETLIIPFYEKSEGLYKPEDESFKASFGKQYELEIILANGKRYRSDKVSVKKSAGIDRLDWEGVTKYRPDKSSFRAIDVSVTTNQDEDASQYYRYFTEETWLTWAKDVNDNQKYKIFFTVDSENKPVDFDLEITQHDNITFCWVRNNIKGLSISSTEGQVINKLNNFPVYSIPVESPRLIYKYSVLIKQYSIPKFAHHFLEMVSEFSEGTGSLFDVQPGFVEGNIRNVNDDKENVIGIFYASSITDKRLILRNIELEPKDRFLALSYDPDCFQETVAVPITDSIPYPPKVEALTYLRDTLLLRKGNVVTNFIPNGSLHGDVIVTSRRICSDCTGQGTNVKPDYWGDIF